MAHLMAQTMAYYPPQDMAYPCFEKSSLAKKILFSLPCFFKFSLPLKLKKISSGDLCFAKVSWHKKLKS